MKKSINFKGAEVVYTDSGKGVVLFFLHGYLETMEIWYDFNQLLRDRYRIITMDIPGHGESKHWNEALHVDEIASSVLYIIDREKINRIYLIGHSLGGYITMAFAELYRERLKGYCLFHSTCFPDTEEKRINRDREIRIIKNGKKNQVINVNIARGFADDNLDRLRDQVERAKMIAHSCSDEGTIALLRAMKSRPDRSHILAKADLPVLLIGGMKDNYISAEDFEKLTRIAPHATVVKLENSGHMGFVEEPGKSHKAILSFTGG
ncbi:MAG TPA: alpha/beta hydrolase [Bacteroidaceae bacterium]|nr:alpha/beta hydrolase [Bacteroidaceae bacterium]